MGAQIFLKSGTNKAGKAPLFIYAQHKGKKFKKNIGISIDPKDWNKKTYQVKNESISSVKINRKLLELTSTIREAWSLFESDIYSWEEFCQKLNGGRPETDVESFIEEVFKPRMRYTTYNSYKYSYMALKKALGADKLSFKELNHDNLDNAVITWRYEEKSPSTIETYLKHLGVIINEANDRGLVNYKFEKKKKWRVKKHTNVVESTTTDKLLASVSNVNDLYDFQTFAFWLLMFCMRGLYPRDLVNMYKFELINEDQFNKKRYVKHRRSKTGEQMTILYSCQPTEWILNSLKCSITFTHLNRSKKFPDVYPRKWNSLILFEYNDEQHRNVWDIYTKRCRKLLGVPFKVARKTFESYAMLLDVSAEVRYRLLGHQDRSIKRNYQNWEWEKMIEKVDESHIKVLQEFKVEKIWKELQSRGREIGLPTSVVTRTLMIKNGRNIKY